MTITLNATIDAPLEDVWFRIADFPKRVRSHPGVERCETMGEDAGVLHVYLQTYHHRRIEHLHQAVTSCRE